ncbi:MAG: glycosyltransferase [Limnohabitans sp.]|uniref:glycosyltransferase n=1 Tax=Limnohabitans sp. TaxID=1907725 RepID=UPI0025CDBD9F|nr:glycosyltransferase [Limnohabitans sp.]MCO4089677.1 glycosyltransferase [Limnohabitans sp.]
MASLLEVSERVEIDSMRRLRIVIESVLVLLLALLLPLRVLFQVLLRDSAYSVWCGQPIIAMAVNCRAERLLGVRSISIVTQTYFVTQAFDIDTSLISKNRVFRYVSSWGLLLWVLLVGKRVHTYCDGGLLASTTAFEFNPRELFLYRLAGLKHVVWTYGADVRTRSVTQALGEPNCCTDCDVPEKHCICDTSRADANIARVKKTAVMMASMGDMNEYLPLARHDLHFWPLDLDSPIYNGLAEATDSNVLLRVVHASNHRQFKGSRHLITAVETLRQEGLDIELVLVERVPNAEAMKIYRTADIVFDQCLIGFHGYFALEAMALGKPVMVFIRKPEYLLDAANCPLINVTPETIADRLRWFMTHRADLAAIGKQSRQYMERHYGLSAFANRLRLAYEDANIRL